MADIHPASDGIDPSEVQVFDLNYKQPDWTPVDTSWVTTEPVYEGPAWLHWVGFAAKLALLLTLAATAVAVILK